MVVRKYGLADLPETIPVFPLPGALLLPRARLPLNIFEPRYLALLEDTLKTSHRLIGMIQPVLLPEDRGAGRSGDPGVDWSADSGSRLESREALRLHRIGCAGRVTAFQETEDGRYVISASG